MVPPDLTDAQLSAFLDGELEPAVAARLQQRIEEDPALQARLRSLTEIDRRLAAAFHVPDDDPAVRRLAARLAQPTTGATAGAKNRSRPLGRWVPQIGTGAWHLAMAASVALVIGAGGGWMLAREAAISPTLSVGIVVQHSPLEKLLAQKQTGAALALTTDHRLSVTASFRDEQGRICRELEVGRATDEQPSSVAFACLTQSGRWTIAGVVALARTETAPGYQPSSGATTDVVAGLAEALRIGQALSVEDERRLISNGWR